MYFGGLEGGRGKTEARPAEERVLRERRKHERSNASTPLMIKEDGGFKVAKTVNLSLGGARVISDAKLPLAKTMDIILVLGDRACPIKSDVIYSEKPENETSFFYSGLKFRDMTDQDIRGLEDYLLHFRRKGNPSS
jgi:hypothetical protein